MDCRDKSGNDGGISWSACPLSKDPKNCYLMRNLRGSVTKRILILYKHVAGLPLRTSFAALATVLMFISFPVAADSVYTGIACALDNNAVPKSVSVTRLKSVLLLAWPVWAVMFFLTPEMKTYRWRVFAFSIIYTVLACCAINLSPAIVFELTEFCGPNLKPEIPMGDAFSGSFILMLIVGIPSMVINSLIQFLKRD